MVSKEFINFKGNFNKALKDVHKLKLYLINNVLISTFSFFKKLMVLFCNFTGSRRPAEV